MAQFKNVSGLTLYVPAVGVVAANAIITVADVDADGYAGQTAVWQPQDTAATNAENTLTNALIIGPGVILSRR